MAKSPYAAIIDRERPYFEYATNYITIIGWAAITVLAYSSPSVEGWLGYLNEAGKGLFVAFGVFLFLRFYRMTMDLCWAFEAEHFKRKTRFFRLGSLIFVVLIPAFGAAAGIGLTQSIFQNVPELAAAPSVSE